MKVTLILFWLCAVPVVLADVTVSDIQVFSGHPWNEIVVGYTIAGRADETSYVRLIATDKDANKTYIPQTLIGAKVTAGRHIVRWNASAEGVKLSSTNVVFAVCVVEGGVQLWENGPYWAECNIGASKPEEYGYYFWWGDTIGYKRNADNNGWVSVIDGVSYSFGGCPTYDKNNSELQSIGYIDSTGNLVAAHDAAAKHFGAPWRIPTDEEWQALISNCTTTWTERNGVYGRLVTGKGAYALKSIFLPAAGVGLGSGLHSTGPYGIYWSSTHSSGTSRYAWCLCSSSSDFFRNVLSRDDGRSVRPVRGFAK